jgi:hypothetical protein
MLNEKDKQIIMLKDVVQELKTELNYISRENIDLTKSNQQLQQRNFNMSQRLNGRIPDESLLQAQNRLITLQKENDDLKSIINSMNKKLETIENEYKDIIKKLNENINQENRENIILKRKINEISKTSIKHFGTDINKIANTQFVRKKFTKNIR